MSESASIAHERCVVRQEPCISVWLRCKCICGLECVDCLCDTGCPCCVCLTRLFYLWCRSNWRITVPTTNLPSPPQRVTNETPLMTCDSTSGLLRDQICENRCVISVCLCTAAYPLPLSKRPASGLKSKMSLLPTLMKNLRGNTGLHSKYKDNVWVCVCAKVIDVCVFITPQPQSGTDTVLRSREGKKSSVGFGAAVKEEEEEEGRC